MSNISEANTKIYKDLFTMIKEVIWKIDSTREIWYPDYAPFYYQVRENDPSSFLVFRMHMDANRDVVNKIGEYLSQGKRAVKLGLTRNGFPKLVPVDEIVTELKALGKPVNGVYFYIQSKEKLWRKVLKKEQLPLQNANPIPQMLSGYGPRKWATLTGKGKAPYQRAAVNLENHWKAFQQLFSSDGE